MSQPVAVDDTHDESDSEEHLPPQTDIPVVDEVQHHSSPDEPSPSQPQYVDIDEIQDEPEAQELEPPIRIEQIPEPGSQNSAEYTQTMSERDKPESTHTDHGFNGF